MYNKKTPQKSTIITNFLALDGSGIIPTAVAVNTPERPAATKKLHGTSFIIIDVFLIIKL